MKKYLLIPATALFVLMAAPASAVCRYDNSSGQYRCYASASTNAATDGEWPPLLVIFGVYGLIIAAVAAITALTGGAARSPKELHPSESAEHYDQEATRTRAYARKLDAEASLAESQLRASLKQDELKEFESFLRDKNARGRRK